MLCLILFQFRGIRVTACARARAHLGPHGSPSAYGVATITARVVPRPFFAGTTVQVVSCLAEARIVWDR